MKEVTVLASLMFLGSVFQSEGPATEKDLSPICFFLDGTTRRVVSMADLVTGPIDGSDFFISEFAR